MAIRTSGLISGLDTESLVTELVSAYSVKKDKYVKQLKKQEWTISAWQTVNSKVYSFYSSSISNMRYSSAYATKKASVSNSAVATVSASSDAVNSTQTLSVKQLASSGYLTGAKISDSNGNSLTGDSKLSELGITDSTIKINDTSIDVTSDMTVTQLITKMKSAGVNANFDETNQRIFISSKTSGSAGEFSLTAGDASGISTLQKLGIYATTDKEGNETAEMAEYRKLASADADELISSRYDSKKYTVESYTSYIEGLKSAAEKNLSSAKDKLDAYNAEDYDYTKDFDSEEAFNEAKAELQSQIDDYQAEVDANQALLDDPDALQAAMDAANDAIKADITTAVNNEIDTAKEIVANAGSTSNGAVRIAGKDAVISLNGAEFTSNSNSFSINGLNITATALTTTTTTDADGNEIVTDNPVTISTSTDTQGIYDKIKSMLKSYNELVSYMDGLYYAEAADGYEPLTDDEEAALTDSQADKWEEKVKNALLRKDSTISSITSAMKSAILGTTSTSSVTGKEYSLSNFGIATLSYFTAEEAERGTFHIDGDSDDANTSGNSDKLMSMLSTDPDGTVEFFQKMAQNVYNALTKKMSASSISSAFTIYNDKQMSSQYCDYKDKVSDWEDKLEDIQNSYYSKFAAMETALSKLQSSSSAFSSMLG